MSDLEVVKKMLRAVLQSKKSGVSLSRLQSEYWALTGEFIPHKQMGYPTMEAFLRSVPSVARMEVSRVGEVVCFAAVCKETAHIAQLVARQRTSKKAGGSQLVNCQMRVKPSSPFMLYAKPRTSLRQPEHLGRSVRGGARQPPAGRPGCVGDRRQTCVRDTQPEERGGVSPQLRAPEERGVLSPQLRAPKERGVLSPQLRAPEERGVLSPQLRTPNVQVKKPSVTTERPEKRMTLPSRFQKEVHAFISRNSQQTTPAHLNENNVSVKPRPAPPPAPPASYNAQVVQGRLKEVLHKHSNGFWVSKLPQLYRELYKQELPPDALRELEHWSHICTVEKPCSSNPAERLLYPSKDLRQPKLPVPKPPARPKLQPAALLPSPGPRAPGGAALAPELKQKLALLLGRYTSGLWAHALPKLFQEAYKSPLPAQVLGELALLADICTVEYPMPDNTRKAILYAREPADAAARPRARQEAGRRLSSQAVPPLALPAEEYPSVLVVEAGSTNSVVLRYIGEGYSQAQEQLEDEMREFYSQAGAGKALLNPATGQLAAVRAEEEEEVLRAQVREVTADRVKVGALRYSPTRRPFFLGAFQAAKCKLAGLEPFCQDPAVLQSFEALAGGKILLAEILERGDTPLVVLYDTSQDDDVNINTACLKAVHDKSLGNPLQVNSIYANVSVTNVCSDGTVFCHLPSRGQAKLSSILEKAEAYFLSQVTPEFLVSKPFCGKCCLARYKGKWARVEITNLHGSRVLDILFVDLGVPASVEVIELREIPPPFLRELMAIPPQAIKCCLADLSVSGGSWTPDAVLWLRDAVLNSTDCSMKVCQLDEARGLVQVYLFSSSALDPQTSVNQQLLESSLWKRATDVAVSNSETTPPAAKPALPPQWETGDAPAAPSPAAPVPAAPPAPLQLPPLMQLPQPGHNMDIYVSVACHPGHFVLQPWQDLYKLVVLMGEMILYYNKMEEKQLIKVEKNQIYAAKVESNWHRVLVKGVLTNGLVSVYELDYGKHELVDCSQLQPLINEFRQLPFQGITAQLAGVKPRQWSEEASIVFRNHVEKKPLVAQVESVQEAPQPWDRKVVVYLVDTSQEEKDVWVHDIMAELAEEQSRAA
ncbi:tudor domain-containing protein 7B-like [Anguilla rostrata]|uniref:tudor domain-containing protein 7B-like n=1 Tax=Anguilla rostrata TaxID=7938 RepID=UPI0030D5DFCA